MGPNRVIASYDTEAQARHAIDELAHRDIPVDRLAIVTEGESFVRRFRDRIRTSTSVLVGALVGGFLGAMVGLTLGLSLLTVPGFVIGAVIGGIAGPAAKTAHPARKIPRETRHDSRFDVIADCSVAEQADRVLREVEHRELEYRA